MFATLVINAVFMTVATGLMFAFRGDTRAHRGDRVGTAAAGEPAVPAGSTAPVTIRQTSDPTEDVAVHIPRQHEATEEHLPGPSVLAERP
jgi:hypothetical protein